LPVTINPTITCRPDTCFISLKVTSNILIPSGLVEVAKHRAHSTLPEAHDFNMTCPMQAKSVCLHIEVQKDCFCGVLR